MKRQIVKFTRWGLAFLLGCSFSLSGYPRLIPSVNAITSPNGVVSFEKPPRLIDASTTFNDVQIRGATYYFDLELPEDAGEPLQTIVIGQRSGQEEIEFRINYLSVRVHKWQSGKDVAKKT